MWRATSNAKSMRAMKSRWSSRRCPARPTNWSPGRREAAPLYDPSEYDAIVASGELVTAGLLAIVLKDMGLPARSWQGWQIPLLTDDAHGAARIAGIDGSKIIARFADREIAVVAGFQGLHAPSGRVTTLGRGGSDTSAVALGRGDRRRSLRHLHRRRRRLYDRPARSCPRRAGWSASPSRKCWKWPRSGAKVLQVRSVEVAMVHKVKLIVRSSFDDPADPETGHAHLRRGGHCGKPGRHRHRFFERRGPDSPCVGSPTSPASRRRSSCRWPTPISMST